MENEPTHCQACPQMNAGYYYLSKSTLAFVAQITSIQKIIARAKRQYFAEKGVSISRQAMQIHPRDAWKNIRELSHGTSAHHNRPYKMHHRLLHGNISAGTADATLQVVQPYCQKQLYYRDD